MYIRIAIVSMLILSGCSSKEKENIPETAAPVNSVTMTSEQLRESEVETGIIKKHKLNSELIVNGVVDVPPQNIVSVSFPFGGYLKSTRLIPGMQVRKGEVIATVEDQSLIQLQQDYLVTKTNLEFLEKDYKRQELLHENQVNADKIFQKTQSDYSSQKIMLKGYEEKLKLAGIDPERLNEQTISRSVAVHSPINGFVSKVNVNTGKFISPTDVLFELINPSDIHAALTVFEKDLGKIKPGQKVSVSFINAPSEEYPCEVMLVSRNVDESRGSLVHCHFEKQPKQLIPGMFLRARISINNAEVIAVPEDAVVRFGEEQFILENKEGLVFRMIPVSTGINDNGMIEVKSDEAMEGKSIIIKNAYPVMAKMKSGS